MGIPIEYNYPIEYIYDRRQWLRFVIVDTIGWKDCDVVVLLLLFRMAVT